MAISGFEGMPTDGVLDHADLIVAGLRTEDEAGAVLRLHLVLERFLNAYLKWKIHEDIKTFVRMPRYFGEKLGIAVAFGFDRNLAAVFFQFNGIRNELVHGNRTTLDKDRLQDYFRGVRKIMADHPELGALDDAQISFNPDTPIKFGSGNLIADMAIAWLVTWQIFLSSVGAFRHQQPEQ